MRVGDAHPTSSKISDALKLAEIDESKSFLRQGEQLISNFGRLCQLLYVTIEFLDRLNVILLSYNN